MASTKASFICPLCERAARPTRHHLVPRSRGGKEIERICSDCHQALHAFFDNREIAERLSDLEALRADPDFARHLRFVSRQPAGVQVRTKTRRSRRR